MYSAREEKLIRLYVVDALNLAVSQGESPTSAKAKLCGNLTDAGFTDRIANAQIVRAVTDEHGDIRE